MVANEKKNRGMSSNFGRPRRAVYVKFKEQFLMSMEKQVLSKKCLRMY